MASARDPGGRQALVAGQGAVADSLAAVLSAEGFDARVGGTDALTPATDLLFALYPVPSSPAIADVAAEQYDIAFAATMKRLYAELHATVPVMRGGHGRSVAVLILLGEASDDYLAQGLADGMEAVVAAFAARFATPPGGIRVNALRIGAVSDAADADAVARAAMLLADSDGAYVNGMTVSLLSAPKRVRV